jgi:hypothetical protein
MSAAGSCEEELLPVLPERGAGVSGTREAAMPASAICDAGLDIWQPETGDYPDPTIVASAGTCWHKVKNNEKSAEERHANM